MRILSLFILILLTSQIKAQEATNDYYTIPPDSLKAYSCMLVIKNDSIIEIKNRALLFWPKFNIQCKYSFNEKDSLIKVNTENVSKYFQSEHRNFNLDYLIPNPIYLRILDKVLIDSTNKVLYTWFEDTQNDVFRTYIINGKEYLDDIGIVDGKSTPQKTFSNNKKLTRRMRRIRRNLEKYEFSFVYGLEAYQKFGYEKIAGVHIINKKKK